MRTLTWRIIYALTTDAVVILEVFAKKTKTTPKDVISNSKRRMKKYRRDAEE
jgi:phage-related protein